MCKRQDLLHLNAVVQAAKTVGCRYYELTGKALGVTGEVGEQEAARLLGITLARPRERGFDASEKRGGRHKRIQIKTRCLQDSNRRNGRTGSLSPTQPWDYVLLVLLDKQLEPIEIHRATRRAIETALACPGSKARNERGQLAVREFIRIARVEWKA